MVERIELVLLVSAAGLGAFYLLRALHVRRVGQATDLTGRPSVLYFYGANCAVCPTQGRYLDQVAADWDGRVRIVAIDAENEPETARRYAVLSLPTTILLDGRGQARQVNYGLVGAAKLNRQIAAVMEAPGSPALAGSGSQMPSQSTAVH